MKKNSPANDISAILQETTIAGVYEAARTLDGVTKKTQLLDSPFFSALSQNDVYLKPENLQNTGSFKVRGAYNKIAHLTDEERAKGVITSSAGNHAQGVALAAQQLGVKAVICMPATTPLLKVEATRSYGAEVVLAGDTFDDDTLIVSTSGRYEFRNKGIDVFIDAMNRLRFDERLNKKVVAFIDVPAWVGSVREDLVERLKAKTNTTFDTPLQWPMLTHWLHNMDQDNALSMLRSLDFVNNKQDKVKIIFVPCYLNGNDGIFNIPYYDLILGNDLCVYPSYYEPWGYTPLEAVAFSIPCITTDLAGFGIWAQHVLAEEKAENSLENGVKIVHRTDYNYHEVADEIKDAVTNYSLLDKAQVTKAREKAKKLSKKALWEKFIVYYEEAYDIALRKADERNK